MPRRTSNCGCEEEECVCHFYHYDCACQECPECADGCFCFNSEDAMEHLWDKPDPQDLLEEGLLGERPELDPFTDDTPLECGLEDPVVCESCQ